MYLIGGLPLPEASYYDDGALYENGVGAIRRFVDGFERGLAEVPRFEGRRIRLVTGGSMAPFLDERASALAAATAASVEVLQVENRYFGDTVTIAGLLGGRDILNALQGTQSGDLVVLPAEALNADDIFIDDVPMDELRTVLAPASICTGYEVTEALRSV
jgi:NifB/MoaA-like Fe-S oxidoreductase